MTNANGAGAKQLSDQNTDGAIIGQTASDKSGFHGEASEQFTTHITGESEFFVGGNDVRDVTTFNGGLIGPTGFGYYTIHDIVRALKDKGILDLDGGLEQPE